LRGRHSCPRGCSVDPRHTRGSCVVRPRGAHSKKAGSVHRDQCAVPAVILRSCWLASSRQQRATAACHARAAVEGTAERDGGSVASVAAPGARRVSRTALRQRRRRSATAGRVKRGMHAACVRRAGTAHSPIPSMLPAIYGQQRRERGRWHPHRCRRFPRAHAAQPKPYILRSTMQRPGGGGIESTAGCTHAAAAVLASTKPAAPRMSASDATTRASSWQLSAAHPAPAARRRQTSIIYTDPLPRAAARRAHARHRLRRVASRFHRAPRAALDGVRCAARARARRAAQSDDYYLARQRRPPGCRAHSKAGCRAPRSRAARTVSCHLSDAAAAAERGRREHAHVRACCELQGARASCDAGGAEPADAAAAERKRRAVSTRRRGRYRTGCHVTHSRARILGCPVSCP
jgi:hypothetical protein